ncbi:hypothetical protein QK342_11550 [Myroides odoratimimus]|nr:hypothetical protein [Myroides odoratimimus]MDM1060089.1 hypothetical protein [Myroides odoratimimus]MDM1066792.1 hypothetical protein [Myroides odoratimimus]MDM1094672.1 hypothetical protein [Myroides odoratimimus]MDM1328192.1 hypothetical protein [Myroides odoratimimus]MDM1505897.1 hypothetical protein [Myroides odoratimimus]
MKTIGDHKIFKIPSMEGEIIRFDILHFWISFLGSVMYTMMTSFIDCLNS